MKNQRKKVTSKTLKTIRYEWTWLSFDEYGDVHDLCGADNFEQAVEISIQENGDDWCMQGVCLMKMYLCEDGYVTDTTRAYYDSGWLQEDFEDATPVPKAYIKEVNDWFNKNS